MYKELERTTAMCQGCAMHVYCDTTVSSVKLCPYSNVSEN